MLPDHSCVLLLAGKEEKTIFLSGIKEKVSSEHHEFIEILLFARIKE